MPIVGDMKWLMIGVPGHSYAEAVSQLKRAVDCWHRLEEALLAAARGSPRNADLQRALDLLGPLQECLHDALNPLTQMPSRHLPII
jgi:hypothetical protein